MANGNDLGRRKRSCTHGHLTQASALIPGAVHRDSSLCSSLRLTRGLGAPSARALNAKTDNGSDPLRLRKQHRASQTFEVFVAGQQLGAMLVCRRIDNRIGGCQLVLPMQVGS